MAERPSYVHADYWRLLGGRVPEPPKAPENNLKPLRDNMNAVMQAASDTFPFPAGMAITSHTAPSSIDGHPIPITRFVPLAVQQQQQQSKDPATPTATPKQRAIIYAFGGGLVAGTVSIFHNMIAAFAEQTGTQIFAPDYRLAPEHPYPAAFHDLYATFVWLQQQTQATAAEEEEFGDIDPARLILFGQSAGGNLAAAAALEARDRKLNPPLAGLAAAVPYTAAPGRATDDENDNLLHGLPPTYLGVGDLDLFRDETARFAAGLEKQGVEVESKIYPGVPHGFDGNPAFASLRGEMWGDMARFIRHF
ncbi:Alpha/Beta hydrolase protein [Apiospora sp. TS-2023a]